MSEYTVLYLHELDDDTREERTVTVFALSAAEARRIVQRVWNCYGVLSGTLTITLRRSLKAGAKSEDDSYDVAEVMEALRGFRRFLTVNRDTGEVNEVTLSERGDLCTCEAGKFKVASGCKHRHALRALVHAGGFTRPAPANVETFAAIGRGR